MNYKLTREKLPFFKRLPNHKIDILKLQNLIRDLGYDKYEDYVDLDNAGEYQHLCNQYFDIHEMFIDDKEKSRGKGHYNGQHFRQLALTSFDYQTYPDVKFHQTIGNKSRAIRRATSKGAENYLPQLDERNYCIPNKYCQGQLLEILQSFKAKVTRVRLAALMPGFKGKPHIDYNTDYSIRIHLPIFTNEQTHFYYVKGQKTLAKQYMPADGSFWFVNTGYTHYVENLGSTPRLHLVICLESQEDLWTEKELEPSRPLEL